MHIRGEKTMVAEAVRAREQDGAWTQFEQCARIYEEGRRAIVPVLGTGFNAQAGVRVSWRDLLVKVSGSLSVQIPSDADIVGNTTLLWEVMVMRVAVERSQKPHLAELRLLKEVAKHLQELYPPEDPQTRRFAERFLACGFHDVISYNFDQVLHTERLRWSVDPERDFSRTKTHAWLNGTRLWYPQGTVLCPESINLGMRNYGSVIQELEKARIRHKADESRLEKKRARRDRGLTVDQQRQELWAAHRKIAASWVSVAMNAPLLFVGLGLGREEWPLWWFLNQRARNHARREIMRPVFAFMPRKEAAQLRTAAALAQIELLVFDDFGEGWTRLWQVLEGS